MVYTIFLGKQGKRVYTIGPERGAYTIGPERRVYTIEASDPENKKTEGLRGGSVYFFFPVLPAIASARKECTRLSLGPKERKQSHVCSA